MNSKFSKFSTPTSNKSFEYINEASSVLPSLHEFKNIVRFRLDRAKHIWKLFYKRNSRAPQAAVFKKA